MSREKMIAMLCRLRAANSARLFDMLNIPAGRRGCLLIFGSQYVVTPVKASSALPVRRTPSSS